MAKKKASVRKAASRTSPVRYKKDFLDQVITRADFAAPLGITPAGPPSKVVAVVKKQFPVGEFTKHLTKTVRIRPSDAQAVTEEFIEEKYEWVYHSKDRRKVIKITDDTLVLEYKKGKYRSFEPLRKDFLPVVDSLYESVADLQIQRLGLRYIDKIELDEKNPTEWKRYLHSNLLSIFNLADNRPMISRALHWLEFNYGNTQFRFQYGMSNPDYPAPIRQKIFMLDSDAYCTLLLNKDEVSGYLTKLHDKTRSAFEEVILDPLRQKMGPIYAD